MPTVPRRRNSRSGHLVVCGDESLAFRIIEELAVRYGEDVTVILPSKERNHGPKIASLQNVRVIERPTLTDETFREARLGAARSILGRRLGIAFAVLFAILCAGYALLVTAGHYAWPEALYLTLLDTAGAAVTNVHLTTPERFAQVMLGRPTQTPRPGAR